MGITHDHAAVDEHLKFHQGSQYAKQMECYVGIIAKSFVILNEDMFVKIHTTTYIAIIMVYILNS